MSWTVILTQIVLPLVLLGWLALFPATGWLALGIQLLSVAAVLLGIALAALWTLPPFWTPYVYALAWVLISAYRLSRADFFGQAWGQNSTIRSIIMLTATGLGLLGSYLAYQALLGRILPDEAVVDIAPPFEPGYYLIAHGGASPMVNVHLKTLDQTIERYRRWHGQSKAMDLFRITPVGLHKDGWQPSEPYRYTSFGATVLAPCHGNVARVVDGLRDMPVPQMDREHMAGNYVAIDCGDFFVFLAHLRLHSLLVSPGERVDIGQPLAQMGNSGNSSEPHLHLHAQRNLPRQAPMGGEPLWLTINGRFLVRNSRLQVF